MADSPPSVILRTLLTNAGGIIDANPASAWSAHISKMPSTPDAVLAIFDSGGLNPNPAIQVDQVSVQVMVRGNPNGYQAAYQKAQDVKDALLGIDSQDVGTDRVVSVTMIGDIAYLGRDSNDRPELSVNFRMILERTPSALSNRIPV
jgi:hypothetical protein